MDQSGKQIMTQRRKAKGWPPGALHSLPVPICFLAFRNVFADLGHGSPLYGTIHDNGDKSECCQIDLIGNWLIVGVVGGWMVVMFTF